VLTEALTALAAAGGTAVVQAAGQDAWTAFRIQVAKWFSRGDAQREHVALEHLDRAATALKAAGPGAAERVRAVQEASWQTRFESVLEGLGAAEQQRAAGELRDLLAGFARGGATAVGPDAVAVAGDVSIHAETGGAAAWEMGSVQINPSPSGSTGAAADPHRPGRSSG
jgi:hypothetical protein